MYRYVTEQTFDAYLYQLVESKQKFIAQIMTSKSPVRCAEDVDETVLSFAEVKMLATGDARFKEKMELDLEVARLTTLKQSYLKEHHALEDRILQQYPQKIRALEQNCHGYEQDAALARSQEPKEGTGCSMTLKGQVYPEKAMAGAALLALCKEAVLPEPATIGTYRGFSLELEYDTEEPCWCLNLCGMQKHRVKLGPDALGNLTRIDNELARIPAKLEAASSQCQELRLQLAHAEEEVKKPFAQEQELEEKTAQLTALNLQLHLEQPDSAVLEEPEEPEQKGTAAGKQRAGRER